MFWLGRGNSLGNKFSSKSPEVGWSRGGLGEIKQLLSYWLCCWGENGTVDSLWWIDVCKVSHSSLGSARVASVFITGRVYIYTADVGDHCARVVLLSRPVVYYCWRHGTVLFPDDHVTKSSATPLRNQSVLSKFSIWVAQVSAIWLGSISFY